MDIFEKIAKKFHLVEEKSTTEQINEARNDLKLQIAVKLYNQGFSDEEIANVIGIIINAENEIKKIKDSLIGTNINPEEGKDPMKPLIDGQAKIREISLKMNDEVRELIKNYSLKHQQNN